MDFFKSETFNIININNFKESQIPQKSPLNLFGYFSVQSSAKFCLISVQHVTYNDIYIVFTMIARRLLYLVYYNQEDEMRCIAVLWTNLLSLNCTAVLSHITSRNWNSHLSFASDYQWLLTCDVPTWIHLLSTKHLIHQLSLLSTSICYT